jgi:protoporphyrin/coproporphyrin ferrochelatase
MVNNAMNGTYPYDAILMVSFGGPEGRDDVIPFLENVLRGKNVPRERLLAVAEHYYHFDGISPINAQNRALIDALEGALVSHDVDLPIYWGNRNWYPLLTDTMQQMKHDGIQHALAFFTSAYSSYSGCRQYREDIARAQQAVGEGAPQVSVLRKFYNHAGFIGPNVEHVQAALAHIPVERLAAAQVVFTAHSIPLTMARNSMYESQLLETCRLVADGAGLFDWKLVYQSRSGSPHQPWLEPDILEHLRKLKAEGAQDVVIAPVGFISDHMEVLYDLDTEAQQLGREIGLNVVRAATVGTHPQFIDMICELIIERLTGSDQKSFLGTRGASHDVCPDNCCLLGIQQPSKAKVEQA